MINLEVAFLDSLVSNRRVCPTDACELFGALRQLKAVMEKFERSMWYLASILKAVLKAF